MERKKSRLQGRCEVSIDFLCEFEVNSVNVIFQVTWEANGQFLHYEEVETSPAKLSTDVLRQKFIRYGIDVSRYIYLHIHWF